MVRRIRKILNLIVCKFTHFQRSYSQCGEDVLVNYLINITKLGTWTWIDIGAHHPTFLSNTAFFYKRGIHGINIEADPQLIKKFYTKRRKDINLNIAITSEPGIMNFYKMSDPTLSTLSKDEAYRLESFGNKIEKIISVPTMTITNVIDKYCNSIFPEVLFLDAEGLDLQILKTISWDVSFPKIVCVENVSYGQKIKDRFDTMQKSELTNYLKSKNYSMYVFTGINSIFVQNEFLERKQ
jgi:FkbM family methyltransferase